LLYALKAEHLSLDRRTTPSEATAQCQREVLAKAEIVATYHR
jgi:phosphatidylethanolamine-binding protein (PEBP) family uncharacterized protein